MWELLLSLHRVQTVRGGPVFGTWRRRLRPCLPGTMGLLTTLARPCGYSPDFLTPAKVAPDLETGLELLLSTPRTRLRTDIAELARQSPLPTWVSGVADGDVETLKQLADALRSFHRSALEPFWQNIRRHVEVDWRARAETAATSGFEAVLRSLHPSVRWRAPVLEVDYPVEQELHLHGRGLVLVPSFFCWDGPITTLDGESSAPVLVYPVERPLGWTVGNTEEEKLRARSLTALLGRTRAVVLRTIADRPQVNTTDLANALGISLAGASQHATVLRNAGLVQTARTNGAAVHRISREGATLLRP